MDKYQAFGTLTLEVSKLLESFDDESAAKELLNKFNTYGIKTISVKVELENGEKHDLKVHDHDMEWSLVEKTEREKINEQTA